MTETVQVLLSCVIVALPAGIVYLVYKFTEGDK